MVGGNEVEVKDDRAVQTLQKEPKEVADIDWLQWARCAAGKLVGRGAVINDAGDMAAGIEPLLDGRSFVRYGEFAPGGVHTLQPDYIVSHAAYGVSSYDVLMTVRGMVVWSAERSCSRCCALWSHREQ